MALWSKTSVALPEVRIGEVMRANGVGVVVASRTPELPEGMCVTGQFGAAQFALARPSDRLLRPCTYDAPPALVMSLLHLSAFAAHVGLFRVGGLREQAPTRETVVVSAAAGSVGFIAVQLARVAGARVVGIAGTAARCRRVVDEGRIDACVDRSAPTFVDDLRAATGGRVDLYLDGVGGPVSAAVASLMALRGRIAVAGSVADYEVAAGAGVDPLLIVVKRLRVEGFMAYDHLEEVPAMEARLWALHAEGALTAPCQLHRGLEALPRALRAVLDGEVFGKALVEVC
jgi:NADPH-dependent curcumin reductase CurA